MNNEQIDRLDELAAKATPGPWKRPFSDRRIYPIESDGSLGEELLRVQNYTHESSLNLIYIAAANPQAVSELIAMLRESQKDAALYKYQRKQIMRQERWLSEAEYDECIYAAMQLDCDGSHHANA